MKAVYKLAGTVELVLQYQMSAEKWDNLHDIIAGHPEFDQLAYVIEEMLGHFRQKFEIT